MYTFPKKERLSSKKNIHYLFESGKTLFSYPFKVYYHFEEAQAEKPNAAVLFSIGKKQFKFAVDRNRVKRLCRESYRLNKSLLINTLVVRQRSIEVAFIFVGKTMPEFEDIEVKMQKVLLQLSKIDEIKKPD